jgi:predicted mannosyl-3-phosphoglycerate phosphatase (HAD superfamily)
MHDNWCFEQIREYSDLFAEQWEVKTVEKSSVTQIFETQPLSREKVALWVETKAQDVIAFDKAEVSKSPSPRILQVNFKCCKPSEC